MLRRTPLALLLCTLAPLLGCGGSSTCEQSSRVTTIFYGDPGPGRAGATARACDGTTTVVIQPNDNRDRETSVVVHELFHVAGFSRHTEGPCYTAEVTLPTYPSDPCPEEIARLAGVTGTFEVQVADAGLRPRVVEAAALWNQALGREMFRLAP